MSDADTDAGDDEPEHTVLVVDDEQGLADLYTIWLEDDYEVHTAYNGTEALDALDDSIDVVLLDRQMPDVSGDDVLDALRARDLDCRVAMVTAVEPELDIIELGFDDYIRKPVNREELRATVDRLLRRSSYDSTVQAYFSTARKRAVLADSEDPSVTESEAFNELDDELAGLRRDLDNVVAEFDDADYEILFRRLRDASPDSDASPDDDDN